MDIGSLFVTTLQGGLGNLAAYLAAHVLLCLLPAFFIAGAMTALIPKETITRFLGRNTPRFVSYPAAALAGSLLAVCSCTIVPLFAGIYKKGAGIGPAITFLFFAPAANVLALVYTGGVIGADLAFARQPRDQSQFRGADAPEFGVTPALGDEPFVESSKRLNAGSSRIATNACLIISPRSCTRSSVRTRRRYHRRKFVKFRRWPSASRRSSESAVSVAAQARSAVSTASQRPPMSATTSTQNSGQSAFSRKKRANTPTQRW